MLAAADRAHWLPTPDDLPPRRGLTCGQLLDVAAAAWPGDDALVYCAYGDEGANLRWTFAELRQRARDTACALLASGSRPGERVGLWATNLPEWFLLQFGAAYAGLVLVPLNPLYTTAEVEYVLRRAEVSVLFVEPENRGRNLWEAASEAARAVPSVRYQVALGRLPDGNGACWNGFAAQVDAVEEPELDDVGVRGDDLAQIQFTSGTTGFPKGAMLRHGALTDNARMFAARAELRRHGRACSGMPQFHCGGSVLATLGSIATGTALAPLITFNPRRAIDTLVAEHATALLAVPAMMLAIEAELEDWDSLASLERVVTGGSLVPPEIARRWHERLGVTFSITYGLTEASPVITQSSPSDALELQVETVGTPLPNVECDVADAATGVTVAVGEEGEVRVRGWQVMAGYFGDERATADAITDDGWLRTGDLGRMDADGYVRITGRAKDVIIRGGENLYPAEIEAALRNVDGVLEAFVVGVPDERYGEVPAAFVRLTAGAVLTQPQMRASLEGRIARFKIPAHLRVVTELPLTSSGKVQKFRLRERFLAERVSTA
jgi:acyl-CoA synthetase (AMP-forming)/AMP-acid ligase II